MSIILACFWVDSCVLWVDSRCFSIFPVDSKVNLYLSCLSYISFVSHPTSTRCQQIRLLLSKNDM
uniref:Uncharacterized protein n=1 Tax=Rhizophora mucronata TaxID=61149 RepID=A0A2P2NNX9_RHIMU